MGGLVANSKKVAHRGWAGGRLLSGNFTRLASAAQGGSRGRARRGRLGPAHQAPPSQRAPPSRHAGASAGAARGSGQSRSAPGTGPRSRRGGEFQPRAPRGVRRPGCPPSRPGPAPRLPPPGPGLPSLPWRWSQPGLFLGRPAVRGLGGRGSPVHPGARQAHKARSQRGPRAAGRRRPARPGLGRSARNSAPVPGYLSGRDSPHPVTGVSAPPPAPGPGSEGAGPSSLGAGQRRNCNS